MNTDERWQKIEQIADQMITARSKRDFDEMCRTYYLAKEFSKNGDSTLDSHMSQTKAFLKHWFNFDIDTNESSKTNIRRKGFVRFFNRTKNFGYISQDDGSIDVFFHGSNVLGSNPFDGDRVEYELFNGNKGIEAGNVRVI